MLVRDDLQPALCPSLRDQGVLVLVAELLVSLLIPSDSRDIYIYIAYICTVFGSLPQVILTVIPRAFISCIVSLIVRPFGFRQLNN